MLDIKVIREEPERVKAAMRDLNDEEAVPRIDLILELDERRRSLLQEVEEMRAEKNKASKIIGQTRNPQEREAKIGQMKSLNARLDRQEAQLREVEETLAEEILWIPNLPAEDVPVGPDETHNVVLREEGAKPEFDFEPLPHWDIGAMLGILDFERGDKLSGVALLRAEGRGRAPAAGADHLDARRAHAGARLHRDLPAVHGAREVHAGHRQPAQVRRQPVSRRRRGLLVDPHGGGAGDQPAPRGDHRGRRAQVITWPTRPASAARR